MAYFSWLEQESNLTPAALTVRAQTVSPNDQGTLLYDAFFPVQDIRTTRISDITTLDYRPVADRREWNTRGRHIPLRTPDFATAEMTPVESYYRLEEGEINKLVNDVQGNMDIFRQQIAADIPARTDMLASANYRRVEVDAMTMWALGQITVKNPQSGATTTVALGYDSARYVTAGTAWNNGAVNAYNEFLAFMRAAADAIGPTAGAVMRQATMLEILNDAPNPYSPGNATTVRMTVAQLGQRIQDDLGRPFVFYIVETSLDIFNDGGNDTTRTKVWPVGRVAAVPAGERVGSTYRAPVARAWNLARSVPDARIDVRGMAVFPEAANNGRELVVECQGNYMSLADEARLYVMNAGV